MNIKKTALEHANTLRSLIDEQKDELGRILIPVELFLRRMAVDAKQPRNDWNMAKEAATVELSLRARAVSIVDYELLGPTETRNELRKAYNSLRRHLRGAEHGPIELRVGDDDFLFCLMARTEEWWADCRDDDISEGEDAKRVFNSCSMASFRVVINDVKSIGQLSEGIMKAEVFDI